MSAFSLRVTSGALGTVDTGFRIPYGLIGTLQIEHSRLPDGMSLALHADALVLVGAASISDSGDWPILVSFYTYDGLASLIQLPVSGLLVVDSAEDIEADGLSASSLALGDYYYTLIGGPLRKEMRDGF